MDNVHQVAEQTNISEQHQHQIQHQKEFYNNLVIVVQINVQPVQVILYVQIVQMEMH